MLEISKYLLDSIKADNSLKTLLGADSSDERTYSWNPPFQILFSSTYKAAIFYRDSQNPRPTLNSYPSQKGNIYYYFSIESPNKNLVNQIAEYLISKFDNKPFVTTNWRIGSLILNQSAEGVIGGTATTPIYKRNLSFLMGNIFKRTNPYD
jgi:hypothetical protein